MKPRIAISAGDVSGIGPEVVLKSVLSAKVRTACVPVIIGSLDLLHAEARRLRLTAALTRVRNQLYWQDIGFGRTPRVVPGIFSKETGLLAGWSLMNAVALARASDVAAIVTAPVSKQALHLAGFTYPGQTEMLQALTRSRRVAMMLVGPDLRVGLVSIHVPLRKVAGVLSSRLMTDRISTIHEALKSDWGITRPRIAVLALNPHAGEGGALGHEEARVITPTLRRLVRRGMRLEGPFPADAFFARYTSGTWDAVVAMYHDQGLIPLKMRAGGHGINVSVGLPIIRTSPDHGTAPDIAGKNLADPSSMIEAILLAVSIARHRAHYLGTRR